MYASECRVLCTPLNIAFYNPLKTAENQSFSGVSRGFKKENSDMKWVKISL